MPGSRVPHRQVAHHELADLFGVLGHPLRLALVFQLRHGERDVTALIEATEAPQSAVSQALAKLKAARLVVVRRAGRNIYYRLTLDSLPGWLDGGLGLLELETAQIASLHDAISLTRRDLEGEPS